MKGMVDLNRLLQHLFSILNNGEEAGIGLHMFLFAREVVKSHFEIVATHRKPKGYGNFPIGSPQMNLVNSLSF